MRNLNTQITAYSAERSPKAHDKQLLEMIKVDFPSFFGAVLDIGCAAGSFIELMSHTYPGATYTGIDISDGLIAKALRRQIPAKAEFLVSDAVEFEPVEKFDIVIASGVLSIFDDFSTPLKKWLTWLKPGGKMYVFGRFNSENIDTIIFFRNNAYASADWEGGLTSYSVRTILSFVEQLGLKAVFTKFHLPFDLPRDPDDPIRTFTVPLAGGQRMVLNGANVVAEHHFLKIWSATI